MEQEIQMQTEPIIYTAGGGAVDSVNGYTGVVVLTTSDLENTSDYQTGSEVESAISTAIAGKQDTLTAGSNISIQNDTISATDTTYTAGNGLNLTGTEFSADTTVLATQSDLSGKQDTLTAGANIAIASDNTISATDTTYSNFTGTDGTAAGTAGLVPAPATTDAGKFLKADGTWDTAGNAGPTVVQTTGTSQANVMSQNATTSMVFADPSDRSKIRMGESSTNNAINGICIGRNSKADSTATAGIAIGSATSATYKTIASGSTGVALGYAAQATGNASIALGSYSKTTLKGQIDVSTLATTNTLGYNDSQYRLLSGIYDGQSAHDAATYGQLNTRLGGLTIVSILQTDYDALATKDPNTLYVITGA